MITMTVTKLKTIRTELTNPKMSQEDVSRSAKITLATYRNAESGKNVSYTTATEILNALNVARRERSLPALSLNDLDLHIV